MYIPFRHPAARSGTATEPAGLPQALISTTPAPVPVPCATSASSNTNGPRFLTRLIYQVHNFLFRDRSSGTSTAPLVKRQYNGNAAHDLNVTIGIIVGVLIGSLIVGIGVFLYFFGDRVRFSDKSRRVRRVRSGGGSSKSSKSSSGSSSRSMPPPPPPPGPPTAPPP